MPAWNELLRTLCECAMARAGPSADETLRRMQELTVCTTTHCFEGNADASFGIDAAPHAHTTIATAWNVFAALLLFGSVLAATGRVTMMTPSKPQYTQMQPPRE